MSFDNVCKILAEKYPRDFANWLLPEQVEKIKVLKTELSIEPIRADSVIFLQTENRILHLEFQTNTKSETPIPLRMLDYFVRLVRQYNLHTAAYTEILAGLRFDKNLIRQLLSEDIMQESVIYQDILQKGEQKEAFRFLNRQLNRRFGEMDSFIIERIRLLPTEQLEILGEEFLDFSEISDLVTWLDTQIPRSL